MSRLEIRSENGGVLTLTVLETLAADDIHFRADVEFLAFRGSVRAYTYLKGPPSQLFLAMDQDWRGWEGEKNWESTDSNLQLAASIDPTGHVVLRVEMRDHYRDCRLSVPLTLEGGNLQRIAADAKALFETRA